MAASSIDRVFGLRTHLASRAAALSFTSNLTLMVMKFVVGIMSGSIAVLSDAVDSAEDVVASLFAFLSIQLASQPADEEHPYGHGKAESLAAAGQALLIAGGALVLIAVSRHRPTSLAILHFGKRLPLLRRFVPQIEEFYETTYALLSPRAIVSMGALSTVSWFFEVLGFYFTLVGLGLNQSGDLLLHAAFILPISTLASALFFTPGGLGVAEGGIAGLSQALLHMSKSSAAVGTLIIRFGTLWFGVIVGLIAFAILNRRLVERAQQQPAGAPALAAAETLPEVPL